MKFCKVELKNIIFHNNLAIYGAGTMGKAIRKCLTEDPFNLTVDSFIVKNLSENPDSVDGCPVIDIAHASAYKDSTILIALNGKLIPDVIVDLTVAGFTYLVPISFDGDEWTSIRAAWFEANGILPKDVRHLSDMFSDNEVSNTEKTVKDRLHIYVAHSVFDRELSEKLVDMPCEIGIQVGSALTDKVMFDVRDSVGEDNISDKNRQYCELTGIYWAWKNDSADYVGFSHYRRRFILSDNQIKILLDKDIDVVVTEPLVNFATVKGQYAKDHVAEDWNTFMGVIGKIAPEYLAAAENVQDSIYYFAYNMFIMKRDIFNKYCQFIFPILNSCEELIGVKDDVYQNRYIGFLAERLLSIFLAKNTEYSVAIADKHFME